MHSEPTARAPRIAEAVRAALAEATADFSEVARRYAAVIEKRAGVELPDVEPTVRLGTTDLGKIVYRCALFCPRDKAAEMEQVAIRAFLAEGGAVEPGMG